MITLAHISDIHLGPLPQLSLEELLSKRISGYLNWKFKRSKFMAEGTLQALVAHMKAQNPDFTAITGDLVNLASAAEIDMAGAWLEELGPPDKVCVVPGNHDAYVAGSLETAETRWGPYMAGQCANSHRYPYVRQIGDVAIIGCASAVPRPPLIAAGEISTDQAQRLAHLLDVLGRAGLFRVVMIHHPPVQPYSRSFSKGLRGAGRVREAIRRHGAELVLHGHLHRASVTALEGPKGEVPVIGVAAAASNAEKGEPPARYNLFTIEKLTTAWSCTLKEYGFQHFGDDIVLRLQMRLY